MIISNKIEKIIVNTFDVSSIEIIDETHKHRGHPQSSGGHFKLIMISNDFKGLSLIERHRMIYKALDSMMKKEIHALSIHVKTTEEI
tara:strand:- start:956 stop:1216 length:261 start_codon:yes stop_codon:yes gene_type:complete